MKKERSKDTFRHRYLACDCLSSVYLHVRKYKTFEKLLSLSLLQISYVQTINLFSDLKTFYKIHNGI